MKAAQIDNYGDASDIQIREVEKPQISDDQVLVEVTASSLNPFDSTVRSGGAHGMAPMNFPGTLGADFVGTIAEIGANVTGFSVGDRVYGQSNALFGASGAFAEFTATNSGSIALAPSNVNDEEAASLPLAGVSALQAIVDHLNLQSGQKLFINGGTGGIGSTAIQIAKNIGAYVAVTTSSDNVEYAKSLGADEVIDYKSQDYTEVIHDYDAVLNNVYNDETDKLLTVLKKGGIAVSLANGFDESKVNELGVTGISQMTHVSTKSLDELRELVEQGVVEVKIDKVFPLDQIKEAFTVRENESIKGKVVITIK
ncbi:MAG: NADP-dependent oxidoreductase [Candidatus Saccharimonadales bacterium]